MVQVCRRRCIHMLRQGAAIAFAFGAAAMTASSANAGTVSCFGNDLSDVEQVHIIGLPSHLLILVYVQPNSSRPARTFVVEQGKGCSMSEVSVYFQKQPQ